MAATAALGLNCVPSDHRCTAQVFASQECASAKFVSGSFWETCKLRPGRLEARTRSISCRLAYNKVGERDDHGSDPKDQSAGNKSRKPKYSRAATVGSGAAVVQERSAPHNGAIMGTALLTKELTEKKPASLPDGALGGLIDKGLVYREKFIIRCYEVGTNRTASMEAMANLLQECACNHAQSVGFSTDGFATTPAMRKRHLIWVTTRMHIEIDEYPVWGQVVEIDTWFQGEAKIATRRDWLVRHEDGRVIGRATSVWVMMNTETRRLCRIPEDVRAEYMDFVPLPPRWAIPGEDSAAVRKIGALEEYDFVKSPLLARRSDLDMNQHVNNVTYMGWMLESMPRAFVETHELMCITLDYKRECKHDDVVESMTSPESVERNPSQPDMKSLNGSLESVTNATARQSGDIPQPRHFTHLLRLVDSGIEINRGRTEWRRKVLRDDSH
ncbi:fatty acyl-ACP thioesterase A [Marchantia polymorpha subsp. ruderalis]|nr:hypothetical protein MARPO_0020s0090 [Marchantia polymorpha]BBN09856.1 hypothetical protein Mp_4g23270 [Marchantia polymorpha subsp. ruderalis]|eukprot:PTQ44433.1 hypothetical protein MARPO_0020s0090 [Marchantia polymorpha]